MKKTAWSKSMILLASFLAACGSGDPKNIKETYVIRNDTVFIRDVDLLNERILVEAVCIEPYTKEVITAATVQAIPTQFAYIAPPFAGRVNRSYVKLGQKVSKDTPLFEIFSADFTAAQKEFYQAQSERDMAWADYQRKEDLLTNGVGSRKELEEALNAFKIAEKEYENATAAIRIYQVDPEKMVLGQLLIIRSPIAGEIIENNLITGQYLSSESDYVAIVADLSKVWITAQVKEKDIRFIHEGDEMNIEVSAFPGHPIKGEVYHIDEAIDEETRSIKVLSVCDNKEGLLKLGMYATVNFLDKPAERIVIPEKALLQDEKYSYVYVEAAPGTYSKTPVEVEITREGKAVILAGLNDGNNVIVEGGYFFK